MLRFLEGFETRQNLTYYTQLYATVAGALTSFGAQRKAGVASGIGTNFTLTTYPLVSPVENTWIVGFGYFAAGTVGTTVTIMDAAAAAQLSLVFAAGTSPGAFTIAVKRGVTTLATSVEISAGAWHFIELKATIRTGVNGSYELVVDGVSLLSASGINTANTAADGASVMQFNWGGGAGTGFDDIYVCDGSGGIHDDFLGDKVVLGILPTADGAATDWVPSTGTDHFAMVDDLASTPVDSDYNQSNVDGDIDLYEFGNLTEMATDGTLDAVVVFPSIAMLSTGSREVKVRVRASGGSTADSDTITVSSKTIRTFAVPFDQDPVAVAAWTKAVLDGDQIGVHNIAEV
jgi:hypothetical protein